MPNVEEEINGIIKAYKELVLGIEREAVSGESGRAYGGIIRAGKGKLVESITKEMILIAWQLLGANSNRIKFDNRKVKVPINKNYINNIKNPEVKQYLLKNLKKCYYGQKSDLHVYIDNKFVMAVECKAYTENAMMKRILVDFMLLKKAYPNLKFLLVQLESQLGGDFSTKLCNNPLGSFPTHTLLSHFDVELNIITLLEGERDINKPIHKKDFFKPLKRENIESAIKLIENLLKDFV
jgi:hypothetical protein